MASPVATVAASSEAGPHIEHNDPTTRAKRKK